MPTSPDLSRVRLRRQGRVPVGRYSWKYWDRIIKHGTGFKCWRPYLSSSIPCFKTKNLPALERARASPCLAFKASVLQRALLDPPMLIFNFSFKFTVKQRKNLQPKCLYFATRYIFQGPSATATAPVCQATCPQEMEDNRKRWGSISLTDIAQM